MRAGVDRRSELKRKTWHCPVKWSNRDMPDFSNSARVEALARIFIAPESYGA